MNAEIIDEIDPNEIVSIFEAPSGTFATQVYGFLAGFDVTPIKPNCVLSAPDRPDDLFLINQPNQPAAQAGVSGLASYQTAGREAVDQQNNRSALTRYAIEALMQIGREPYFVRQTVTAKPADLIAARRMVEGLYRFGLELPGFLNDGSLVRYMQDMAVLDGQYNAKREKMLWEKGLPRFQEHNLLVFTTGSIGPNLSVQQQVDRLDQYISYCQDELEPKRRPEPAPDPNGYIFGDPAVPIASIEMMALLGLADDLQPAAESMRVFCNLVNQTHAFIQALPIVAKAQEAYQWSQRLIRHQERQPAIMQFAQHLSWQTVKADFSVMPHYQITAIINRASQQIKKIERLAAFDLIGHLGKTLLSLERTYGSLSVRRFAPSLNTLALAGLENAVLAKQAAQSLVEQS